MKAQQFQIEQKETNDSYILSLAGELDLSVVPQLRSALEPVMDRKDQKLVLNLRELSYIDSTGIGIIVSILKYRDGIDAPFSVTDIPPTIQRLFDLTGISGYLTEGTEQ
ncbi:STAS domain-containing protein [Paenibacillus glycanilyticus]|uniref:Anti-sigma factor antagonist n=1 Tax=Paenibacillus glycanilyticus TaxID=126569 RepID=A0ABQ6G8A0_9BACL|nr:STAS domain-containing protein [Paenibacillus glycanilyticus]GLX66488.1 anti-sigma-B factor antagonist [Paenibacillus glycanilyticus]